MDVHRYEVAFFDMLCKFEQISKASMPGFQSPRISMSVFFETFFWMLFLRKGDMNVNTIFCRLIKSMESGISESKTNSLWAKEFVSIFF